MSIIKYKTLLSGINCLDLGCGKGRNVPFFKQLGLNVTCVDKDLKALAEIPISAGVKVVNENIMNFEMHEKEYDLIFLSSVINFLTKSEFEKIVKKIIFSLRDGGMLYLDGFTKEDPSYMEHQKIFVEYFDIDEIKQMLDSLQLLYLTEGKHLDITHGDPHYHCSFELLARKSK